MPANFHFAHSRSVQPAYNANLQVAQRIKDRYLPTHFTPSHDLLAQLDAGYDIGDPLCDAWLADAENLPAHGMKLFRQALHDGVDSVADAPESLNALFAQTDAEPDWLDRELVAMGSNALGRYPLKQGLMLQSVALMGGYSVPALAQPLHRTNALTRSVVPRIARTLAFTAAVTMPNGLTFGEVGYRQAIHTRVVHGLVRANLMKATQRQSDRWDVERFGLPISQTDMIATNMVFSLTVIHGLLAFKCQLSDEEQAGILHLWRYVAHLLGIDDVLMPKTEQACNQWLYSYLVTQKMDAKSARPLAQSLHDLPMLIEDNAFKGIAKMEQQLRAGITRMYWGDDIGDDLGLPNPRWTDYGIRAITATQLLTEYMQRHSVRLQQAMEHGADGYRHYIKGKYLVAKPDLKPLFDEIEATYDKFVADKAA